MHIIDLHTHSTVSDGTFTPRELAFYAKAKGLTAIALTDHDTVSGLVDCMEAGKLVDLKVIPGVELTAHYGEKEIHILGYGIDPSNQVLKEQLDTFLNNRKNRNLQILEKLQALSIEISLADLYAQTGADGVITRAHFARALVAGGYTNTMDEAFDRYLLKGRPAYVKKASLSYAACISLIHQAGGIAIVAHPMLYKFSPDILPIFFSDLANAGLDGIEVIYPKHSLKDMALLMDLCHTHSLLHTGGSDFHGANKENIEIGIGYGDTFVPATLLPTLIHS